MVSPKDDKTRAESWQLLVLEAPGGCLDALRVCPCPQQDRMLARSKLNGLPRPNTAGACKQIAASKRVNKFSSRLNKILPGHKVEKKYQKVNGKSKAIPAHWVGMEFNPALMNSYGNLDPQQLSEGGLTLFQEKVTAPTGSPHGHRIGSPHAVTAESTDMSLFQEKVTAVTTTTYKTSTIGEKVKPSFENNQNQNMCLTNPPIGEVDPVHAMTAVTQDNGEAQNPDATGIKDGHRIGHRIENKCGDPCGDQGGAVTPTENLDKTAQPWKTRS